MANPYNDPLKILAAALSSAFSISVSPYDTEFDMWAKAARALGVPVGEDATLESLRARVLQIGLGTPSAANVEWSPKSFNFWSGGPPLNSGAVSLVFNDTALDTFYWQEDLTLQTLDFPSLASVTSWLHASGLQALTSITFPELTTIGSSPSGGLSLYGSNSHVTEILLPKLQTCAGSLEVANWTAMTTLLGPELLAVGADTTPGNPGLYYASSTLLNLVHFEKLVTVGGDGIIGILNPALEEIYYPALVTAKGLVYDDCTILAEAEFPLWTPGNGGTVSFKNCALEVDTVNHLLARCVANVGYVTGTVDLSGGTSAAPAGQGATDKATLIGRGVTVTTN